MRSSKVSSEGSGSAWDWSEPEGGVSGSAARMVKSLRGLGLEADRGNESESFTDGGDANIAIFASIGSFFLSFFRCLFRIACSFFIFYFVWCDSHFTSEP